MIAPLLEGHKATGKYVASAIVNDPADGTLDTASTSVIVSNHDVDDDLHSSPHLPSALPSPESSATRSEHYVPPPVSEVIEDFDSDDTTAAKRHQTSKAALAARGPIKKKRRSGVEMMENLSSTMQDYGSTIESSITSTSANIELAAQRLADPPSSHAEAVKLVYQSDLTRTQRYDAVALFAEKPLMAETYLNTPAVERNDWLEYILNK